MTTDHGSTSTPADDAGRLTMDDYVCGDIRVSALYADALTEDDLRRAARNAGCDVLLQPRRQPIPRRRGWNVRLINRDAASYRDVHAAWTADNQASGDQHGVWLSLLYELDDEMAIDYPDRDNGRPGSCTGAAFFHHVTSGRFASGNLVEVVPADGGPRAILVPRDATP